MKSIPILVATTALFSTGCADPAMNASPQDSLAKVSDTGLATAKRIESTAEFVGGPRGDAQLDDFIMENSRIRVAIQDIGRGIAFDLYGGHIIDADVVRDNNEEGQDLLGEVMTAINVHTVVEGSEMEVLVTGASGQPARLQLRGKTTSFPLFSPNEPMEAWPYEVTEDYVLEPDVPWIEIRTTLTNMADDTAIMYPGDLLFFGSALVLSSEGVDYGEGAGKVEYLTAHHETLNGASYGWTVGTDEMIVPFEDASQSGALGRLRRIPPGESRTFTRYLLVGDRDSASVTDAYYELSSTPTGLLNGQVNDVSGQPANNVQVIIRNEAGEYITDARSREDGSFQANLPTGTYSVSLSSNTYQVPADSLVPITVGGVRNATFEVGNSGTLAIRCEDENLDAAPCRVAITPSGGSRQYHFTEVGDLEVELSPGNYSVMVSQGIERHLSQFSTVISTGQTTPHVASVARVIDTDGWISMDSHLHAMKSNDSGTPLDEKVRRLVAEGVEIAISTDHDRVTDYSPSVRALGLESRIKTVIGNESSVLDYGHFNVFPLVIDEQDPTYYEGSQFWFDAETKLPLDAEGLFAKMRQNPGEEVIQINHPRDGAKGYLDMIGYNPSNGRAKRGDLAEDFDSIEVQKSVFGDEAVLLDFFSMLNNGLAPTAVGSSDAHEASDHNGIPRTFIAVNDDQPLSVSESEMVNALHTQQAVVSTGIFPTIVAHNAQQTQEAGPGGMITGRDGPISFDISLQAPLWASMDTFSFYENGNPVALELVDGRYIPSDDGQAEVAIPSETLENRRQADFSIQLTSTRDAYYVLVAWGVNGQPLSGDLPLGYTNPIYVDREDDGYDPPGLRTLGPLPAWPEGAYRRGGHHHGTLDR